MYITHLSIKDESLSTFILTLIHRSLSDLRGHQIIQVNNIMRFALSDKSHNWDMKNQINIPRFLPNIPFYSAHVYSSSGFYRSFTSCVKT